LPNEVDILLLDGSAPLEGDGFLVRGALQAASLVLDQTDVRPSPDHIVVAGMSNTARVAERLGTIAPDTQQPLVIDWMASDFGLAHMFATARTLKLYTEL